jgi:hypothetical protein
MTVPQDLRDAEIGHPCLLFSIGYLPSWISHVRSLGFECGADGQVGQSAYSGRCGQAIPLDVGT